MKSTLVLLYVRPSSVATEMGRTLERCFKESRAVDTESLCIIAGEKVGSILILEQGVRILFSMQVWFVVSEGDRWKVYLLAG